VTTVFFTVTPLFHTRLLPLLTHVNFFPADVAVVPAFEHLPPVFVKACTGEIPSNVIANISVRTLRIMKSYLNY
jgi:hypothetical protein